ncbi:MAG TPA: LOG family protein [candidate division Zixibacteria bacterium]|nr:LOG family protein [candidate division Zixibacteria bacterium]HER00019.1 LOG family protein [candidate division Zixibacteria bacterium]
MKLDDKNQRWWDTAPAYILAYEDIELMNRDELRSVRLMLEYYKPELILEKNNVASIIVVFGGTRLLPRDQAEKNLQEAKARLEASPENKSFARQVRIAENLLKKSHFYDEAREFASIVSRSAQSPVLREYVICTGGGPGVMEAANRGAHDVNAVSIGLNITLPLEQYPNPYITPEFCFRFHYFAIRKMHFMKRARALVIFPGGYGTLDEFFEAMTLIQTKVVKPIPVILFGRKFWDGIINFEALVEEGTIDPEDIEIFKYAETAEEAWELITDHYKNNYKRP